MIMNRLMLAIVLSGLGVAECHAQSMPAQTTTTQANSPTQMPVSSRQNEVRPAPVNDKKTLAARIDRAFLEEAAKGDFGEAKIGKLAQERATTKTGKEYGRMLEKDHSAHREKLATLAAKIGMTLPNEATAEGQKNYDRLKNLKGKEFDKEFGKLMRDDHTKDIAKYKKQRDTGPVETAALAKQTIPILEHHLEMAKKL